jgi:transposase-like protein
MATMVTPPRRRNHFDETFKQETVRRFLACDKPVCAFAREAGIEQSVLHRWIKKYRDGGYRLTVPVSVHDGSGQIESEIQQLRKELVSVRESVNILRGVVEKAFTGRYGFDHTGDPVPSENRGGLPSSG